MEQVESIEMCIIVNFSRVLNVCGSFQSVKMYFSLLCIATGTMRNKSEQSKITKSMIIMVLYFILEHIKAHSNGLFLFYDKPSRYHNPNKIFSNYHSIRCLFGLEHCSQNDKFS
mgnify:CR=1 FL=1